MVVGSKSAALQHNIYIILHTVIINVLRQRSDLNALIPHDLLKATTFITSHPLIIILKHNGRTRAEVLRQKSPIIIKEIHNTDVHGQQKL